MILKFSSLEKSPFLQNWMDWSNLVADGLETLINGKLENMRKDQHLDASLDCDADLRDVTFCMP